jgi:hypothetical protein
VVVCAALLAAGCGDDTGGSTSTTAADEPTAAPAEPEMVEVTIADGMIDGLPGEIMGGAVTVDVTADDPETELDFSRVDDGLTEDEFREGLASVVTGGPFPEGFVDNAGAVQGGSTVMLEPGNYFAWTEPPTEGEDPTPPEGFIVAPLTVTDANDADLPETDGTITAVDYAFDVDVEAGDSFTFVNDGAEQFHHAVVFNFGQNDPAAVEEGLVPFLQSEDGAPPPGLEIDFANFSAGQSGVFGPGGTGTAPATFEDGNTYAVVCFISDRTGGLPHVFAHDMYQVFTVGDAAG